MEVTIQPAIASDLENLVIFHDLFMKHHIACDERFTLRSGAEENWESIITTALDDPETLVLIAVAGKRPVGCAFTLIKPGAMDFGDERIGYLCDVYVEPEFRRHGIARRFLESSEDWLRTIGIRTLEASWAVSCREAAGTWLELGFEPLSVTGRKKI